MTTTSQMSRLSQPPIYKAIGARIREKRSAAGLSQAALAQRIGQSRPAVTLIELGQQKCAVHELLAIAEVLNVPVGDLLSGSEVEP